jgi:TRAP-type mannitol/chloroaromatic compound transport system permease large subunit
VLIIMADQLGKSVGDMYKGAFIPGFVLTGLYTGLIVLVAIFFAENGPGAAARGAHHPRTMAARVTFAAFLTASCRSSRGLGLCRLPAGRQADRRTDRGLDVGRHRRSLWHGRGAIASPALRPAVAHGRAGHLRPDSAKLTAFVVFILVGARVFSLTFYGVDGHRWVEHLLLDLPGGQIGFLIVVNILVFVLAFFLDFFELAFIVIPLLGPVAEKLGIDLIWFGVLLAVNMQTSFMHPPFGFSLFFLRSVAPQEVKTSEIYWGAIPFVIIQLIMVALVIAFPQLVTAGLEKREVIDTEKVQIIVPSFEDSGNPYGDAAAGDTDGIVNPAKASKR